MSDLQVAAYAIIGIVFLITVGMPVPFALLLLSFGGVWYIKGSFEVAGILLAQAAADSVNGYVYGGHPPVRAHGHAGVQVGHRRRYLPGGQPPVQGG